MSEDRNVELQLPSMGKYGCFHGLSECRVIITHVKMLNQKSGN